MMRIEDAKIEDRRSKMATRFQFLNPQSSIPLILDPL